MSTCVLAAVWIQLAQVNSPQEPQLLLPTTIQQACEPASPAKPQSIPHRHLVSVSTPRLLDHRTRNDKPPYANPKTSSPTLKSQFISGPNPSITPENSTPIVAGACGGTGYLPSRCKRSIRFRPKALILTRASPAEGAGLGMLSMKRFSAGPVPFLIAGGG